MRVSFVRQLPVVMLASTCAIIEVDTVDSNIGYQAMDPKPELTSLPDVPSRAIVSLLPLQQVISTLPRLHSRFAPIRESVLKSTQRLVLYIGDLKEIQAKKCRSQLGVPFASHLVTGSPLYPDSSFHRLHLITLNQHSVEQLSTLMPNLTHLEVAIANVDISVIPQLITLLTFWGPSLQTLKLLIREFTHVNDEHLRETYLPTVASQLRPLIRIINSQLLALESLSLDLDDSLIDRYQKAIRQNFDQAFEDVFPEENGDMFNPQGQAIDINEAIWRFNLQLQVAADFLNREPPTEAVTAQDVLNQELTLYYDPFWEEGRFTSDVLFKEEKDSEGILNLSILGQLKEFSFDTGRTTPSMEASILQALEKYGSNKLTSISLAKNRKWDNSWQLSALASSPFASRFTQFPVEYEPHRRLDTPFLPVFTNLKVYTFEWSDLGPNQMARLCALASLPNLQCLRFDGFREDTPFLKENYTKLPPFSSVTVLQISIRHCQRDTYQNHDCLQAPYWAHLFPAVQILKITRDGNLCMRCYPNRPIPNIWNHEIYEKFLPCIKRLLFPLRELPSLRKIFYQQMDSNYYGNENYATAEFTPEGELLQTHEYIY